MLKSICTGIHFVILNLTAVDLIEKTRQLHFCTPADIRHRSYCKPDNVSQTQHKTTSSSLASMVVAQIFSSMSWTA